MESPVDVLAAVAANLGPVCILTGLLLLWRRRSSCCCLPSDGASHGGHITRVASLRALGFVYFIAFASLWLNFEACLGDGGLEPVGALMRRRDRHSEMTLQMQLQEFLRLPTLLWFVDASWAAFALKGLIIVNTGIAFAVALGCSHFLLLAMMWLSYLSVVNVGQRMLGYGWHPQLCEFGFLGVFLGTAGRLWDSSKDPGICPVALWLLRWLLFRALFEPGLGKLQGGDPAWWPDLDALTYHYYTQPNPNPSAWFMHAMPRQLHIFACWVNHFVECVLPICLLLPVAGLRDSAAMIISLFMIVLILSGNYSFLQYMMLAEVVPAISTAGMEWLLGLQAKGPSEAPSKNEQSKLRKCFGIASWCLRSGVGVLLLLTILRRSATPLREALGGTRGGDRSYDRWHLVNGYAAFSHMTKSRPEVIIEGHTGEKWEPVEFWCKVGDPNRRPCVIAPLDLPIDWSLWFVPLGEVTAQPWFFVLLDKIMCNSPQVTSVLRHVPSNMSAIRATVYDYTFTSHDADWSRTWEGLTKELSSTWQCLDQHLHLVDFFRHLPICVAQADLSAALQLGRVYLSEVWHSAWWRRAPVKEIIPPVTTEVLQGLLRANDLPICERSVVSDSGR